MFRYRLSNGYAPWRAMVDDPDDPDFQLDGTVECVTTGQTLAEVNIYKDHEHA